MVAVEAAGAVVVALGCDVAVEVAPPPNREDAGLDAAVSAGFEKRLEPDEAGAAVVEDAAAWPPKRPELAGAEVVGAALLFPKSELAPPAWVLGVAKVVEAALPNKPLPPLAGAVVAAGFWPKRLLDWVVWFDCALLKRLEPDVAAGAGCEVAGWLVSIVASF